MPWEPMWTKDSKNWGPNESLTSAWETTTPSKELCSVLSLMCRTNVVALKCLMFSDLNRALNMKEEANELDTSQ